MRFIYALFISFIAIGANAQLDSTTNALIISTCDSNNVKPLSQAMANLLPDKRVYLRGEIHSMQVNDVSFRSLFLGLHEKKSVNYILCELNHSYCFALNLVLKTGDASILAEFENKTDLDSVGLRRYYRSILSLYNYNLKQTANNKISFIGIDCDLQNTYIKPNVQGNYLKAIKFFKSIASKPIPGEIGYLLDEILKSEDYVTLKGLASLLSERSAMHVPELLACFGDFYIIANSVKYFPGAYREKEMLINLNIAVEGIKKSNATIEPKFFGSFGAAHVDASNNNSFASLLNNSKVFKNQVSFIASGYYNCLSTYDGRRVIYQGAPIFGLSRKEQANANELVKKVSLSTKKSIILMAGFKKISSGKFGFLSGYDALLIYNGL